MAVNSISIRLQLPAATGCRWFIVCQYVPRSEYPAFAPADSLRTPYKQWYYPTSSSGSPGGGQTPRALIITGRDNARRRDARKADSESARAPWKWRCDWGIIKSPFREGDLSVHRAPDNQCELDTPVESRRDFHFHRTQTDCDAVFFSLSLSLFMSVLSRYAQILEKEV